MIQIPFLHPKKLWFPPPESALHDPDGLLAGGGDLSTSRLLEAYKHGIFPWYQDGQPILWWSPSIRAILKPEDLHISRSLKKTLNSNRFIVTADTAFSSVIQACAAPRAYASGTWITEEMQTAYITLHALGHAHSIEVWKENKLVGGLYGLAIGSCYFGESMFSLETDSSKVAFVSLINYLDGRKFQLIDCQMMTPHLESLGASPLPRAAYLSKLRSILQFSEKTEEFAPGRWPSKMPATSELIQTPTGNPARPQ